ncbi:unnamed protein product, partial [marine sediment metagenome]
NKDEIAGDDICPQVGCVIHPIDGTIIRAAVNKGFRSPQINELYLFPSSNTDLEPEIVWNYEVGLNQRIIQGLNIEAAAFLMKGKNLIELEQNELPEEAVLRELREETNIKGTLKHLIGVYTEPTKLYGNILLIGYEINFVWGKPKPGSDTEETKFFRVDKLPVIHFASHRAIIKDGIAKNGNKISFIEVLKSKITEATITRTQLFYKGSMGIDSKIMEAAKLVPGEKVQVLNYNNGERLETYTIEEKSGSGKIILYGPASKKGKCVLTKTKDGICCRLSC